MWAAGQDFVDLLAGDHDVDAQAAAWQQGTATAWLDVVSGSWTSTYSGEGSARTTMDLSVSDEDGELIPWSPASPLGSAGQQISVQQVLSVGGLQSAVCEIGLFNIDKSVAEGQWQRHQGKVIRPGGTVQLTCSDALQRLQEYPIFGVDGPASGATNGSAIQALCRGIVGVDTSTLPSVSLARRNFVYQDNRLATIEQLAKLSGLVPRASRAGLLELVPSTRTAAVWDISISAETLIDSTPQQSIEGLYNAVEVTGEATDAGATALRGIAYDADPDSPYSTVNMGVRWTRLQTPVVSSVAQAQASAATYLATIKAGRSLTWDVETIFRPDLEVMDTVQVTIRPRTDDAPAIRTSALVVGIKADLLGGPMTVTLTAPRDEVLKWR